MKPGRELKIITGKLRKSEKFQKNAINDVMQISSNVVIKKLKRLIFG